MIIFLLLGKQYAITTLAQNACDFCKLDVPIIEYYIKDCWICLINVSHSYEISELEENTMQVIEPQSVPISFLRML